MNLVKSDTENIRKAAEIIKKGGTVAFPTETVYGLGADGLNPNAAAKIFEIKERPAFNPLILHVADINSLQEAAKINNPVVELLVSRFTPGPLTFVLPKRKKVPGIITAGNSTVAVRIPSHPVALELIKHSGRPIAAPSANKFGMLSPTKAEHVFSQLGDKVDLILDGGQTQVGVESTIIEVTEREIFLLRPGGISKEEIESAVGTYLSEKVNSTAPNSPGQLPYHYSTNIPLYFFGEAELPDNKKTGALFFSENNTGIKFDYEKFLSLKRDLREAAANLFNMLHELQDSGAEVIFAEKIEESGLGIAIMDRLRKAANKFLPG